MNGHQLKDSPNNVSSDNVSYTYDAFISYRHVPLDKAIAIKLQRLLESYRPPKGGRYANTPRIRKIFRDESELPTSGDLGADIKRALEKSAYLIVVCSEDTPKSQWCMQEITYFKELHNGQNDRILALLADADPRKAFPTELCTERRPVIMPDGRTELREVEVEPLAANVAAKSISASLTKLKTEFLRIAAPILGCGFDDLYRRHQRRLIRNVIAASAAVITVLLSFSGFSYSQYLKIDRQSTQILGQKSEIEQAYSDLEQTNETLTNTNEELKKTNERLSAQIEETNRQKSLAEENRLEAEAQAGIAKENEQTALHNLQLANEQKLLADEQRVLAIRNENRAISNLNLAREKQLFRTVQYAAQLADDGDRVQAAAILIEAKDRFDINSEKYGEFQIQIEAAMANTAFFPAYSPVLMLKEENFKPTFATFSANDEYFAVADDFVIKVKHSKDGSEIGTYSVDRHIEGIAVIEHYLIVSTFMDLHIWDLTTADQIYYRENYYEANKIICNDSIKAIVLHTNYSSGVTVLPYPWLHTNDPIVDLRKNYFEHYAIADNGRYAVSDSYKSGKDQAITVLDLNQFNTTQDMETNLKNMTVCTLRSKKLYTGNYKINNEGILYFKTIEEGTSGGSELYNAILYDTKNLKIIRSFQVNSVDDVLLPNDYDGKAVIINPNRIQMINLRDPNTAVIVKTIKLDDPLGYCIFNMIPNGNALLFNYRLSKGANAVYSLDGAIITTLDDFSSAISVSEVSHDGKNILACSDSGTLILYRTYPSYGTQKEIPKPVNIGSFNYIGNSGICLDNWDGRYAFYNILRQEKISDISYSRAGIDGVNVISISADEKLMFGYEYDNETHFNALRIWNVQSGKIEDNLSKLGKMSLTATYGISPDFSFLVKHDEKKIKVYSLKTGLVHAYELDQYESYSFVGVEDDGHTVWTLKEGTFNVLDMETRSYVSSMSLMYDGTYNAGFAANLKENKLMLITMYKTDSGYAYAAAAYSLNSDKPLIYLSQILPGSSWACANNARSVYAFDDTNQKGYYLIIPDFDAIVLETKQLADERQLTAEERQLSGLNIFDE